MCRARTPIARSAAGLRSLESEKYGVVLSIVLDAAGPHEPSSCLLVLDARDFTELARARAPHSGSWLPGARVSTMSTSLSAPDEE